MTLEELCGRLSALSLGKMETVSWLEFVGLFGDRQTERDQRQALAGLAERCGCTVFFISSLSQFALFTRKQSKASVEHGRERAAA